MTAVTVAGGVYHERCIWPEWDHWYGSAGRAAAAMIGHVSEVQLISYASAEARQHFSRYVGMYGFAFAPVKAVHPISFEYVHSLSSPTIRPSLRNVVTNEPFTVEAGTVLRFGMLEGTATVKADRCVYDPQSAFEPEAFASNGSRAKELAVVANRGEIAALSGSADPIEGARALLSRGADVVVVKSGPAGAFVVDSTASVNVPAYRSDRIWTVGTGDVFAAIFAAYWGGHRASASEAADLASRAVAAYVETMSLPSPTAEQLRSAERRTVTTVPGKAYLAGPFFTLGQRWLIDEARRGLHELGLDVFSPIHDVGNGPANVVAPADLAALDSCDRVFAIVDGLDSGTIFELGYARARGLPVYALAQSVAEEDLKMISGSDCRIFDDFVTALHHTAWRT